MLHHPAINIDSCGPYLRYVFCFLLLLGYVSELYKLSCCGDDMTWVCVGRGHIGSLSACIVVIVMTNILFWYYLSCAVHYSIGFRLGSPRLLNTH